MYTSPRTLVVLILVMSSICLGLGVILGYFIQPGINTSLPQKDRRACEIGYGSYIPEIQSFLESCMIDACSAELCEIPTPNSYVAYHIQNRTIAIDGVLKDDVWLDIPWTEKFVDIRGNHYHEPAPITRVKMCWDDQKFYVGAVLEEADVWANFTRKDSSVYDENSFEVFIDTSRSLHKYKEIGINALGTLWDTMLTKAYIDGGESLKVWDSMADKAVFSDSPINDPKVKGKFWSIELAVPFLQLKSGTIQDKTTPAHKEIWFVNFARSQFQTEIKDGHYQKIPGDKTQWWAWNPTGALNLHLPNRWGLVQFIRENNPDTRSVLDHYWLAYQSLFDVFEALHKFKAVYGFYTDDLQSLDIPPYIRSGRCVEIPQITLDWRGFVVTIKYKDELTAVHIREDRFVWLGDISRLGMN